MFTTASVALGLNSDRVSPLPRAVAPWAKYQLVAVDGAHGAIAHPSGLATDSETATPPPSRTTAAATKLVDPSWSAPTATWDSAGTVRATEWASAHGAGVGAFAATAGTAVSVPFTGRSPALVSTIVAGAPP